MLFKVRFNDGSVFNGRNDIKESLWNEIPDKEIKAVIFTLPDGNILILKDYEAYGNMFEATRNFYGSNAYKVRYRYFLGKKRDKTISYRLTLFENKDSRFKIGDITRREYDFGKEWYGKPYADWKKGIIK